MNRYFSKWSTSRTKWIWQIWTICH